MTTSAGIEQVQTTSAPDCRDLAEALRNVISGSHGECVDGLDICIDDMVSKADPLRLSQYTDLEIMLLQQIAAGLGREDLRERLLASR